MRSIEALLFIPANKATGWVVLGNVIDTVFADFDYEVCPSLTRSHVQLGEYRELLTN